MEKTPSHENQRESSKEKTFLYHMVPTDMRGSVLHPLNKLKETHPDLYVLKVSKYEDRKHIMEQFIPTLECAWNEVLHFTAVHPETLKKALVEAGMQPREMKFYQVDPQLLDPSQTTIYLYQDTMDDNQMNPDNFSEYDPEKLTEHSIIPQTTKDYYKESFGKGERPLLFVGVPHILYKGSIDVSSLPVILV